MQRLEDRTRGRPELPPAQVQLSTSEIISEMSDEAKRLLREEVRLAKSELRADVRMAATGSGVVVGGIAFAFAGIVVLLIAAAAGLAHVMPLWAAGLIVGGAGLLLGGLLAWIGITVIKRAPVPKQTIETLKEDSAWMSETMRGVRSRMRETA